MNVFKDTNKKKKFILIIVFLLLFNFCFARPVHGINNDDIVAAPCKILYIIESSILKLLNNIFCDQERQSDGTIYVSPETIIKGKFSLLDPNIFKVISPADKDKYYDAGAIVDEDSNDAEFGSSILKGRSELRDAILGWYYGLRNLAIVALLSILVYIAIRMMLTSLAQDKAKYKMMLKDWFIALCLLFAMHYIMIAILNITSDITDAIGTSGSTVNLTGTPMIIIDNVISEDDYIWVDEFGIAGDEGLEYDIGDAYAQAIMLFAIIVYTIIFAVKYLIRMITIIFLILLAPITCITYPLDKISDGKAQAYNRWFQEFFYNIIIQPFHLLIYVVLVGTATTLANTNILYGIICFAVMLPAEKLIKEMFGFKDKLGSPLGAFATGAIGSQLLSKLTSGGGSSAKDNNKDKLEGDDEKQPSPKTVELPEADSGNNDENNYDDIYQAPLTDDNVDINEQENTNNPIDTKEERTKIDNEELFEDSDNGNEKEVIDNKDDKLNVDTETNNPTNRTSSREKKPKKFTRSQKFNNGVRALWERRNRQLLARQGTTNRAKAFGKYAGRKLWNTGKRAIRGATTLAGAAALGLVGTMFGQGKAGVAAGAALGNKIGSGIGNGLEKGATNAYSTAKDMGKTYHRAGLTQEEKEKEDREKSKKEFIKDSKQRQKAYESYAKRHNGAIPTQKELNQELEDRFKFREYGFNDDKIDTAMELYSGYKDRGYTDEQAEQMVALGGSYLEDYKSKDFRDEKTMTQAHNNIKEMYKGQGWDNDTADYMARQTIKDAATFVNPNLDPALPKEDNRQQYINNTIIRDNVAKEISQNGQRPKEDVITREMKQRQELRQKHGMKNEQQISEARRKENAYISEQKRKAGTDKKKREEAGKQAKSVIDYARDLNAKYSKKELQDADGRKKIHDESVTDLMNQGYSKPDAEKYSKKALDFLDIYKG